MKISGFFVFCRLSERAIAADIYNDSGKKQPQQLRETTLQSINRIGFSHIQLLLCCMLIFARGITSLNFYFHRSSVNFVCSGNPFLWLCGAKATRKIGNV